MNVGMRGGSGVALRWPLAGRSFDEEDLLNRRFERFSDAESQFQRRRIIPFFDRDDRLPCHADFVGKLLLGHFVMVEAQPADVIPDPEFVQGQTPRR